jgi:hypothetical protein
MRIEKCGNYWFIVRGKATVQYFGFFVDDDSASWSNRFDNARTFKTADDASVDLNRLRTRACLKRLRASAEKKRRRRIRAQREGGK